LQARPSTSAISALRIRPRLLIATAAVALVLLPASASHAGWLSDLFSKKKEPAKTAAQAKPVHPAKPDISSSPVEVPKSAEAPKPRAVEKEAAAKPAAPKCEPAKFHLVVDVGHTRESDGAMSARDVPEFSFNLNLATRLVNKLKAEGFTWTRLMITEGKARPSLIRRVATANNSGADLFLSIHHDSVPDKFMENWEFEGKKLQYSDRFSGWGLFVSHDNPNFGASLAFAQMIGKRMKALGLKFADQYTLPIFGKYRHDLIDKDAGVYRYDHLVVLMTTHMPAVLLEAGSISHRDEEAQMASPERQDMIVGAISEALKEYCGLPPTAPELASEPLLSSSH
jgi:N-acetylmuramoyl-L-alanine amidase